MPLQQFKSVLLGLLFLSFGLATIQLGLLLQGRAFSILNLLLVFLPWLMIFTCSYFIKTPELATNSSVKWELRAIHYFKWELLS